MLCEEMVLSVGIADAGVATGLLNRRAVFDCVMHGRGFLKSVMQNNMART